MEYNLRIRLGEEKECQFRQRNLSLPCHQQCFSLFTLYEVTVNNERQGRDLKVPEIKGTMKTYSGW